MRVVSGILASPLQPGDRVICLQDHEHPYVLETAYTGCESPMGQLISITLITLPGPNPGLHPLLEFDMECVVRIAVQAVDHTPTDTAHEARAT